MTSANQNRLPLNRRKALKFLHSTRVVLGEHRPEVLTSAERSIQKKDRPRDLLHD